MRAHATAWGWSPSRVQRLLQELSAEGLVAGPTQMFEHPHHRIADTVDVGQETLGDDRNAHTARVAAGRVGKVATSWTRHENPVPRVGSPYALLGGTRGADDGTDGLCAGGGGDGSIRQQRLEATVGRVENPALFV